MSCKCCGRQDPDDIPRVHWTAKRAAGKWPIVQMAALEGALLAAKQANAPVEAWEAAASLLR